VIKTLLKDFFHANMFFKSLFYFLFNFFLLTQELSHKVQKVIGGAGVDVCFLGTQIMVIILTIRKTLVT
jgi:hypothetical protein